MSPYEQGITREKSFCKPPFQLGVGLKKVQKHGKDERTQDTRHLQKYEADVGSPFALFHLCFVSVLFSAHP